MSAHAAPADLPALGRVGTVAAPSTGPLWTVGFAAVLTAIAFVGGGGLDLGPATTVEVGLDLTGGVLIVGAAVAGRTHRATHGSTAMWLFAALGALTAVSVAWSVQPADSWLEANRTITYAIVFAGGVVLAREVPERWGSLIGGLALSAGAICCWALATKVFPATLAHDEIYARLRAPYSYWNAIGLTAALGVPACLWLAARRHGHAALNALAYPAMGVLLITLLVSYSRGALLAVALGLVLWFWLVPLRLRGAAVLVISGAVSLAVTLWVFAQNPLSKDNIALGERVTAGHQFGVVLVLAIVALYAAGLLVGFTASQRPLSPLARYRAGGALLGGVAAVPLIIAVILAMSPRGLTGSISHGFNQLTNPHAITPPNDPSRLTAVGSVRARYWNEALKLFEAHPFKGVGAGGYATARTRVRIDNLNVQHAHGYVVQTLADLGLVGLALSLALLAAWLAASMRTIGRARPATPSSPERLGMLTLLSIVVVFGVHSTVDWTWFIPGDIVPALLCAGWLAGRGPLPSNAWDERRVRLPLLDQLRAGIRRPLPAARGVLALIVVLSAAWAAWQPLRSQDAGDRALTLTVSGQFSAARTQVRAAIDRNPLSIDPLYDLAAIDQAAGDVAAERVDYQRAVQVQPANPDPWLQLALFELRVRNDPRSALAALGAALYLDPRSPDAIAAFLQASAAVQAG